MIVVIIMGKFYCNTFFCLNLLPIITRCRSKRALLMSSTGRRSNGVQISGLRPTMSTMYLIDVADTLLLLQLGHDRLAQTHAPVLILAIGVTTPP